MNFKPNWPDTFLTGELSPTHSDSELCADALMAWGNCMSGDEPPASFGIVMAQIANKLGIEGTPESFMKWSKEHPIEKGDK